MRIKRMLAVLLSFMLILGCVPVAMAADAGSTISVGGHSANTKYPTAGDELSFSVALDNLTGVGAFEFVVNIPEGLTYVEHRNSSVEGFNDCSVDVYDGYLQVMAYGHETGYEGTLSVLDFTVTVDEGATGTLELTTSNVVLYDRLGSELATPTAQNTSVTIHAHAYGDWEYDNDHHWYECSCGDIIEMDEHTGSVIDSEPSTCIDLGYDTYLCICEYEWTVDHTVYADHIDDNGDGLCDECGENTCEHTYSWVETKAPNCTEDGEESYKCEICGHVAETKTIDALSHDWDDGVVVRVPTCGDAGEILYTCQREDCGRSFSVVIPALQHEWDFYAENDDEIIYICVNCGETMSFTNDGNTEVTVLPDGTVVIVTINEDGTIVTHTKYTNGVKTTVITDAEGNLISIIITINSGVSYEAVRTDEAVKLPLEAIFEEYGTDVEMTIVTNCEKDVPVEIPLTDVKPGHVVVIINEDGTQTVVATTKMTENGLLFYCPNGAVIKVLNKAMNFSDINGNNWYNDAVDFVSARGIMTGMTANTFEPSATTTRAQVWTMLARLAGVDTTCTEGNWYDVARAWAMENGVSDGTGANDSITREQMVTMLYRFAGGKGVSKSIADFSDAADASTWAKDALEWAYGMGVMKGNGDGTMNPKGNATRAEMAQFFMNFIQNI